MWTLLCPTVLAPVFGLAAESPVGAERGKMSAEPSIRSSKDGGRAPGRSGCHLPPGLPYSVTCQAVRLAFLPLSMSLYLLLVGLFHSNCMHAAKVHG